MIKEQLGKRIAELRKQMNISQEELAEKLNISQKSLSKIETGKNFLTAVTLEKILVAFDISCSELFSFEKVAPPEDLLTDINNYIDSIKNNREQLIILHKFSQALIKK